MKQLSPAERETILRLYRQGVAPKKIAASVGRSYPKVTDIIRAEFGAQRRLSDADRNQIVDLCKAGVPQREIAKRLQLATATVSRTLKQRGATRHGLAEHKVVLSFAYSEILHRAAAKDNVPAADLLQGLVNDAVAALGGE